MAILGLASVVIFCFLLLYTKTSKKEMYWLRVFFFLVFLLMIIIYTRDYIVPRISDMVLKEKVITIVYIGQTMVTYLIPYSGLIHAIFYSGVFNNYPLFNSLATYVLAIPPAIIAFIYNVYPKFEFSYLVLCLWAVPYILFSIILIIYAYIKEKNPTMKKQKFLFAVIIVPPAVYVIFANFIMRLLNYHNFWKYYDIFIFISFIFILFFLTRYGFLGLRLKLERERIEQSMLAKTYGTSIVNHAIKNEILKISMCMKTIRRFTLSLGEVPEYVDESIDIVQDSMKFLKQMIKNLQGKISDIHLTIKEENVSEFISEIILLMNPIFDNKDIKVTNNISSQHIVGFDRVYLKEVLQNVFQNAVEATPSGGFVKVDSYENRKEVCILISDSGQGISKENLSLLFEPFFTTKESGNNFGLGLYFCYLVIVRHGGKLNIKSTEGKGTTVFISLKKH
ncbi:UNVERIFIED_CONTAM: signal transduction histidine kinase [Acetivibrio alkalicellulosi]